MPRSLREEFCYTNLSAIEGKMLQAHPEDAQTQRKFGEWLSLVEHLVRDQGVGGSNPLSPTIKMLIRLNLILAVPANSAPTT